MAIVCADSNAELGSGSMTVKLVELGFWRTVEPGDPAGDSREAKKLHDRVGAKLAGDALMVSTSASSHSSARRVVILHGVRI